MEQPINNKECTDCGKRFRTPADLLKHKNRKSPCVIRELTPENLNNPNRCLDCNRVFSKKENLTRHLKICKIKKEQLPVSPEIALANRIMELEAIIAQKDCELREKDREIDRLKSIIVGSIYFIIEEPFKNKVKIGMSKNPVKRLKQLQTGNPSMLKLYHVIESADYKALERTMHDICCDLRTHGEWFEMDQCQLDRVLGIKIEPSSAE